jgi:hypothetical protein
MKAYRPDCSPEGTCFGTNRGRPVSQAIQTRRGLLLGGAGYALIMKIVTVAGLIIVGLVLLAACGGGGSDRPPTEAEVKQALETSYTAKYQNDPSYTQGGQSYSATASSIQISDSPSEGACPKRRGTGCPRNEQVQAYPVRAQVTVTGSVQGRPVATYQHGSNASPPEHFGFFRDPDKNNAWDFGTSQGP